ncbi:MAG: hypothetical protein EA420_09055 [Candidatus Competibacteraceae bacterium]|nr:MAG: hypothetical protein EA420_09055 [Candidatus Competibacteraceae bacterium]
MLAAVSEFNGNGDGIMHDTHRIGSRLAALELEVYAEAFRAQDLDLATLSSLTETDLERLRVAASAVRLAVGEARRAVAPAGPAPSYRINHQPRALSGRFHESRGVV